MNTRLTLTALVLLLTVTWGAAPALAVTLSADIGRSGQTVEVGFEEFSRDSSVTDPVSETYPSALGTGGSVTIELDDGDTALEFRRVGDAGRTDVSHPVGDMAEDFVFTRGDTLTTALQDLAAGTYAVRTYHHDTFGTWEPIDINVTDADGTRTVADDIQATTGGVPGIVRTVPFLVRADGSNDVDIDLVSGNIGVLTGLELTDAPPSTLRVDIGLAGQDVEDGFEPFSMTNSGGPGNSTLSPQEHWFFSSLSEVGSVRLNLSAESDGNLGFRDRGDSTAPNRPDIAEDFVFDEDAVVLTLDELALGEYLLTTYHHDMGSDQGTIDIVVDDAEGMGRLITADLTQTMGFDTEPASLTFGIASDGENPVTVRFISNGNVAVLNAIELQRVIPEPASFALGVLGLAALAVRRRRRA